VLGALAPKIEECAEQLMHHSYDAAEALRTRCGTEEVQCTHVTTASAWGGQLHCM
jgi:hypothetical protein